MTGTAGYATSVTANLMTQKSEALTTLAQARAHNRIAGANVATNNSTILEQLAKALSALATIQTRVTSLEGRIGSANGGGNIGTNNSNGGAISTNRNPRRTNRNQDNESYCHTHGRTRRVDHTSSTCNHPPTATSPQPLSATRREAILATADTGGLSLK